MYLIELIVKLFKRPKKGNKNSFDPLAMQQPEQPEECEHVFLPVDSTGEILACSNCGMVVNKKELKDINIFKR